MSRRRTPHREARLVGTAATMATTATAPLRAPQSFRVAPAIKYVLQTIFQHTGSSETACSATRPVGSHGRAARTGSSQRCCSSRAAVVAGPKRLWRRGNGDELLTWAAGARPARCGPPGRGHGTRGGAGDRAGARRGDVKVVGSRARVLGMGSLPKSDGPSTTGRGEACPRSNLARPATGVTSVLAHKLSE